jgi:hypothetical protein
MRLTAKTLMTLLVALGLTGGAISNAAAEFKYRSGITQCGFNHFVRLGGAEEHTSTLNLRNPNSDVTIVVTSMRMFLADGTPFSDVPASMLPNLGPHQSLNMSSRDYWLAMSLPQYSQYLRPFQVIIEWSVQDHRRGYRLGANVVRLVRDAGNGAERSRHRGSCRHLELRF